MDRVLIAFDDIQYASHLEMALRKVGFEVESIGSEYNLSEKLLSFNPDVIVAKGHSSRLSTFNIGKKLKESLRFAGKVILIFNENHKMTPDEMAQMRMDLLLFEPLGAFKLAAQVLSLDPERRDMMKDKLCRLAETDLAFRKLEQEHLAPFGIDLDQEIVHIQGDRRDLADVDFIIDDKALELFKTVANTGPPPPESLPGPDKDNPITVDLLTPDKLVVTDKTPQFETVSAEYKAALAAEVQNAQDELPLRIDSYNREIKKIDGDLKKSLRKRHTRTEQKRLNAGFVIDPGVDKLESLDQERQHFASALFKKD